MLSIPHYFILDVSFCVDTDFERNTVHYSFFSLWRVMNLRPKVFHSVKLGDEAQVGLPGFAFVILEKPQSPPGKTETHKS